MLDKQSAFDKANLEAARLILEDEERYSRECALLVIWARRVVGKQDGATPQSDHTQRAASIGSAPSTSPSS